MTWQNVKINSNLIQRETDTALLIKMPGNDWLFWHPKKCCKLSGKSNYILTVSFTDNWQFKIFRSGKNYQKLDEKNIDIKEFLSFFETHQV